MIANISFVDVTTLEKLWIEADPDNAELGVNKYNYYIICTSPEGTLLLSGQYDIDYDAFISFIPTKTDLQFDFPPYQFKAHRENKTLTLIVVWDRSSLS